MTEAKHLQHTLTAKFHRLRQTLQANFCTGSRDCMPLFEKK